MTETVSRLERAADRTEIYDVLAKLCRGLDRLDASLIADAYHEGAMAHHGPFEKPGQELGPMLVEMVRTHTENAFHILSNIAIEFEGDTAWVESYCTAITRDADKYDDIGSRWVDRFERRDGAWKIAERTSIVEYNRSFPRGEEGAIVALFQNGSRDRSDPSYVRAR